LDSNVVIDVLNGRQPVRARFDLAREERPRLCMSSLVLGELRYGAEISADPARQHALLDGVICDLDVMPFDAEDALAAARARAALKKQGRPIGEVDSLIAGQALARGWTLVTANTRHFDRVDGLTLMDWTQSLDPQDHSHG
jgi:tRNA(fMet)-specific endonuclease VapC